MGNYWTRIGDSGDGNNAEVSAITENEEKEMNGNRKRKMLTSGVATSGDGDESQSQNKKLVRFNSSEPGETPVRTQQMPLKIVNSSQSVISPSPTEPQQMTYMKTRKEIETGEKEEKYFYIVPFLEMNSRAEGRLIEDAPSSSNDVGKSIARPFLLHTLNERLAKSTNVEDPAKAFMQMWNKFKTSERVIGQESIYPILEKFVDSLITRFETEDDDSCFSLRTQLLIHLSTLVSVGAISSEERFALFARLNPEKLGGLKVPDVNPPKEKAKAGRPRKICSDNKGKKSVACGMKRKNCSPVEAPPVKIFPELKGAKEGPCCSHTLN